MLSIVERRIKKKIKILPVKRKQFQMVQLKIKILIFGRCHRMTMEKRRKTSFKTLIYG